MFTAKIRPPTTRGIGGRPSVTTCATAGMMILLAGCTQGPEVEPIFKVVPPAQQSICQTDDPDCDTPRAMPSRDPGY